MARKAKPKEYFIVNPSGTVHGVTKAHGIARITADPRYRWANADEAKAYKSANGHQTTKKRLAEPYTIEPPDFEDEPEGTEEA